MSLMVSVINYAHKVCCEHVITFVPRITMVGETHFTRDICFMDSGTHITRDICFLGRETHITRDMCFLGRNCVIVS